jgi:hypothetical protein
VDLARDQLLAHAGLARDEHRGVGRRHQLDLAQDPLQGGTLSDDVTEGGCLEHLRAQVLVLQLELGLESLDLFESARVGDRARQVIGDEAQPVHVARHSLFAKEHRQDAHQLPAEQQRLAGETLDPFSLGPGGFDEPFIAARDVADFERAARGGHVAHLADAHGETAIVPLGPVPLQLPVDDRSARTGDEVQAGNLSGALVATRAGRADVPGTKQPDPRQCHVFTGSQSPDDPVHQGRAGVLLRHLEEQFLEESRLGCGVDHGGEDSTKFRCLTTIFRFTTKYRRYPSQRSVQLTS